MVGLYETFDIRKWTDQLTPKKGKNRYICPVCEGTLTVEPKTGKYNCWGEECDKRDIREAIRPWSEVAGENAEIRLYTPKPKPAPKIQPKPAPIPQNVELAFYPTPPALPEKNSWGETYYTYSPHQWVKRIDKVDGSKITLPYHQTEQGTNCGKGNNPWPAYREDEAIQYGVGKFVFVPEGEKCVNYAEHFLELVSITLQGGSWTDSAIDAVIQKLKSAGVAGLVFWSDHDKPGYKKLEKWQESAARWQMPFLAINPTRIWPEVKEGEDVADWVKFHKFNKDLMLGLLQQEIQQIIQQPPSLEDPQDEIENFKNFKEWVACRIQKPIKRLFKGFRKDSPPAPQEKTPPPDVDFYFEAENRHDAYIKAVNSGKKIILDISGTGAGKSQAAGEFSPQDFGVKTLYYISSEHRNPTVASVEEWQDLPVRNNGLVADNSQLTPLGNPHTHWPKPGEETNVEGNCHRAGLFHLLANKGYQNDATSEAEFNPICNTCSLQINCAGREGTERISGATFRSDRRDALAAARIRAHINSLPAPKNISNAGAFIDEVERQIAVNDITEVKLSDFDSILMSLQSKDPETYDAIKSVILPLRLLLAGEVDKNQENYYGYSHQQILEQFIPAIPKNLGELVPQVESVLDPNWEDLIQEPDSLTLQEFSAAEREKVNRSTLKYVRSRFRKQSAKENYQNLEQLPVRWLPQFLAVLSGSQRGAIRVNKDKLIISVANTRHSELVQAFDFVFLMSATATRQSIALKLGINPDDILVICEKKPDFNNLTIYQVTGLGLCGKDRSQTKKEQIAVLKEDIKQRYENLGILDHRATKEQGEGHWFKDNRGSNQYITCDALLTIGTPYQDIGALALEYTTITGDTNTTRDNPQFQEYINHQVKSEIKQSPGRLRAQRRPEVRLDCYICSDDDLSYLIDDYPGCNLIKISAQEINPLAGSKSQRTIYKIISAAKRIFEMGEEVSQTAIAKICGVSQGWVSQQLKEKFGSWEKFKKLLVPLLANLYRKTNNLSPPLNEEQEFLVNVYLPLLVEEDPPLEEIVTAVEVAGGEEEIKLVLSLLPFHTKLLLIVKILESVPGEFIDLILPLIPSQLLFESG